MLVRRRLFVAAIVVSLLLPMLPARAGALPDASGARTAARLPSLWQQLLSPFFEIFGLVAGGLSAGESTDSDRGPGMDPDGRPTSGLGAGMDPNGGTADSDRGVGMDPNG
jgi:hypothetical protein